MRDVIGRATMEPVPLQPFDVARAELVAGWAVGDEVVRAWCAVEGDRVPAEVVAGWSQADDVEAYLLRDEEGEVELARLLVAPERRGRGVGRSLARALTGRARQLHPGVPTVILRVRPENRQAIRAYTAAASS